MDLKLTHKKVNSPFCVWAQVSAETPWAQWWPELQKAFHWPAEAVIEKWSLQDSNWSKILDSVNSITLFRQAKVIILQDSKTSLKNSDETSKLLQRLKQGPHFILFQSVDALPKGLDIPLWVSPFDQEEPVNEKAAFQWIDYIHSQHLTQSMSALDEALAAEQHPLALLQLVTRDFRLGRVIHYAVKARIRESELASALKVPPFVIQKWSRRTSLSNAQWSSIFDRLLESDLELKSGAEEVWVLRKLTFDLVQLAQKTSRPKEKKLKPSLQSMPLLWQVATSFA